MKPQRNEETRVPKRHPATLLLRLTALFVADISSFVVQKCLLEWFDLQPNSRIRLHLCARGIPVRVNTAQDSESLQLMEFRAVVRGC